MAQKPYKQARRVTRNTTLKRRNEESGDKTRKNIQTAERRTEKITEKAKRGIQDKNTRKDINSADRVRLISIVSSPHGLLSRMPPRHGAVCGWAPPFLSRSLMIDTAICIYPSEFNRVYNTPVTCLIGMLGSTTDPYIIS